MIKIKDICTGWLDGSVEAIKDTPLCSLFKKYNSDKKFGGPRGSYHNYSNFYFEILRSFIAEKRVINYFELGLGSVDPSYAGGDVLGANGGSLLAINDFLNPVINGNKYKHGNIFGADIDGTIKINNPEIKTFQCDQTCPKSINSLWNNKELKDIEFDLIIEDGLHELAANIHFATHSLHKLKPGGIFIVEDCTCSASILGMYSGLIGSEFTSGYVIHESHLPYNVKTGNCFENTPVAVHPDQEERIKFKAAHSGEYHQYPCNEEFSAKHDLSINTVIKTYQSPIWVMQRNY
tara:strand:- start:1336 stop:2211 length:876 start_codon:yes stop_codon:yes gene_type:complete